MSSSIQRLVELFTAVRSELLSLGLSTIQTSYNRKRIDESNDDDLEYGIAFINVFSRQYLDPYKKHLDRIPSNVWKQYDLLGYDCSSGIWEIIEREKLLKIIKDQWRDRPDILTRKPYVRVTIKPKGKKSRRQGNKSSKQTRQTSNCDSKS